MTPSIWSTFSKKTKPNETDELHKIEKEVAYSPLERAKAFVWDGVIKGNVNDTYSGIGALAADFCLYGDIRDITKQTWNLLFDQNNFDGVVGVLSGAGIALSTMPMFDGLYAMNKSTAKYVSKLPTSMNQGYAQVISVRPHIPGRIQRHLRSAKKNGWSIPRTTSCPEQHPQSRQSEACCRPDIPP